MDQRILPTPVVILSCLALALCGCQTVHWSKGDWESGSYFKRKAKEPKTEFGTPAKITAIWKDAVYEQNGLPKTRGFGGRLYFYDSENRPIKVDGELLIYGYDDTITDGGHTNPDHKYVFKQEDLQKHYSKTDIGHSYNIWVPWDDFGGDRKDISLVTVFNDKTKQYVCKGSLDRVVLPGRKKDAEARKAKGQTSLLAKEVNEQIPQTDNTLLSDRLQATTIDVPDEGIILKKNSVEPTVPPMYFNELHRQAEELAKQQPAVGPPGPSATQESSGNPIALTAGQEPSKPQSDSATARPAGGARGSFGVPGTFR